MGMGGKRGNLRRARGFGDSTNHLAFFISSFSMLCWLYGALHKCNGRSISSPLFPPRSPSSPSSCRYVPYPSTYVRRARSRVAPSFVFYVHNLVSRSKKLA